MRFTGYLAKWDDDIASRSGPPLCGCGDSDPAGCMNMNAGYPWCRPCEEHHRAPECEIDEQGRSLMLCGHPQEMLDNGGACPCMEEQ